MLLWQLSWLAVRCLGVRASEARLSQQIGGGGGNLIVQPSPALMSVYPAIYSSDWLLDAAYLHAGYSSGFAASEPKQPSSKKFSLSFAFFFSYV